MSTLKKFFNIESPYKFEWNDLRCFITVINVVLIMTYGLSISWFGLAVAIVGIIKDLTKDRRIEYGFCNVYGKENEPSIQSK